LVAISDCRQRCAELNFPPLGARMFLKAGKKLTYINMTATYTAKLRFIKVPLSIPELAVG
jgi:hypothetical protein